MGLPLPCPCVISDMDDEQRKRLEKLAEPKTEEDFKKISELWIGIL